MACCDLALLILLIHPASLLFREQAQTKVRRWSLIQPARIIIAGKNPLGSDVELKVVSTANLKLYATAQGFADSLLAKC